MATSLVLFTHKWVENKATKEHSLAQVHIPQTTTTTDACLWFCFQWHSPILSSCERNHSLLFPKHWCYCHYLKMKRTIYLHVGTTNHSIHISLTAIIFYFLRSNFFLLSRFPKIYPNHSTLLQVKLDIFFYLGTCKVGFFMLKLNRTSSFLHHFADQTFRYIFCTKSWFHMLLTFMAPWILILFDIIMRATLLLYSSFPLWFWVCYVLCICVFVIWRCCFICFFEQGDCY